MDGLLMAQHLNITNLIVELDAQVVAQLVLSSSDKKKLLLMPIIFYCKKIPEAIWGSHMRHVF